MIELLLVFATVLTAIISYPFIRFIIKRTVCAKKIKAACKSNGFILHKRNPAPFFSGKNNVACDIFIETRDTVFSVKFFNANRKLTTLIFKEDIEYYFRSYFSYIFGCFSFDGKPTPLTKYNFRHDLKAEWEKKAVRNILLINPVPMEIHLKPLRGDESNISAGDTICDMELNSLPYFLNTLNSQKKIADQKT